MVGPLEITASPQLANCPADVFDRAEKRPERAAAGQRETDARGDRHRQETDEKIEPRSRTCRPDRSNGHPPPHSSTTAAARPRAKLPRQSPRAAEQCSTGERLRGVCLCGPVVLLPRANSPARENSRWNCGQKGQQDDQTDDAKGRANGPNRGSKPGAAAAKAVRPADRRPNNRRSVSPAAVNRGRMAGGLASAIGSPDIRTFRIAHGRTYSISNTLSAAPFLRFLGPWRIASGILSRRRFADRGFRFGPGEHRCLPSHCPPNAAKTSRRSYCRSSWSWRFVQWSGGPPAAPSIGGRSTRPPRCRYDCSGGSSHAVPQIPVSQPPGRTP